MSEIAINDIGQIMATFVSLFIGGRTYNIGIVVTTGCVAFPLALLFENAMRWVGADSGLITLSFGAGETLGVGVIFPVFFNLAGFIPSRMLRALMLASACWYLLTSLSRLLHESLDNQTSVNVLTFVNVLATVQRSGARTDPQLTSALYRRDIRGGA